MVDVVNKIKLPKGIEFRSWSMDHRGMPMFRCKGCLKRFQKLSMARSHVCKKKVSRW